MPHHTSAHGDAGSDEGIIAIDSEDAEGLFGALSSATARTILVELYEEPMTPSKLSDVVDTSLQNVNHHLDQLEEAGLVDVVGTATSEQGREMNEYGPTTQALVLHAGHEDVAAGAGAGVSASADGGSADEGHGDGSDLDERWDSGPDVVDPAGGTGGSAAKAFLLGALVSGLFFVVVRLLRRN